MSESPPPFRVVKIRTVEPRPDGTLRRNIYFVDIEVDGAVHAVGISMNTGTARLPQDLIGHPLRPRIKRAALRAVSSALRDRLQELRPRLS